MRRALLAAAMVLAAATPAHAAGGPVPPAFGGAGVSTPGGDENVVALYAGADRTVLTRIRRDDGNVRQARVIKGMYGVPGVTYDGINTGLSADGSTLVLASPSGTKVTRLRVFNARNLRARRDIELRGMNTVDAISPDGRWLYLVDYKNGLASSYDVRAYDLQHGRLLSKPIVDPREPEEKLQGFPVTRVSSEDGRWQYTLYSGEEPFIHALDTEGRTAVCIDMPASVNNDPSGVQLKLAGDTLTVAGAQPHAVVDLKTFKVSEPAAAAPAPKPKPTATPKPAADTDSGPSLVLWLLPLAVLGLVAVLARQRRQSATRARAAAGHSG
jgi:MYXO-CTERM domain-containing protein